MFVDSEFNFKEVERFYDDHVRWFFEDMSLYDNFAKNHPVVSSSYSIDHCLSFGKSRIII